MGVSVFQIIGPSMIGPSSSHTSGMAGLGYMVRKILENNFNFMKIEILINETIKNTYQGHQTDNAIIGGLLGLLYDDVSIKNSKVIAKKKELSYDIKLYSKKYFNPNTIIFKIFTHEKTIKIIGESIGGGSILIKKIADLDTEIDGTEYNFVLWGKGKADLKIKIESFIKSNKLNDRIKNKNTKLSKDNYIYWLSFIDEKASNVFEKYIKKNTIKYSKIKPIFPYGVTKNSKQYFNSIADILNICKNKKKKIYEVIIDYEMLRTGKNKDKIINQMNKYYEIMYKSINQGLEGNNLLVGGIMESNNSKLLRRAISNNLTIGDGIVSSAIEKALAVMEVNGSMGRIIAAPTAGSSGIIPGCFFALKDSKKLNSDIIIQGLFTASGIGIALANAGISFSGVIGGCQSEIGVSSCMAAGGLVEMAGGTPEQVSNAVALSLKNLLGLICDTIAGPVEVPCIKRNSIGVSNAFASADMALAGIKSVIPVDEVFQALKNTQEYLPKELKGTTEGGLACTPTACKIRKKYNY